MKDSERKAKKQNPGGFFSRIIGIFSGMGDPEAEKKKLLRAIARDLGRSRYRFYRPKNQEAQPGLAKFFYEIYKFAGPAQMLVGNAASSAALRAFVIEGFLDSAQKEILNRLDEARIVERAKILPFKELQEEVRRELVSLFASFDGDLSRRIDDSFNTLLSLINFINFDYYFILKKFDSALPERNFAYHPHFESINGEYVAEDVEDFLEVFFPLDFDGDWKRILGALRDYKKAEVVPYDTWTKFAPIAENLRGSQVLELIVRLVKRDPAWVPQPRVMNEKIVEPYLQKLKTQIETLIQKIVQERRNSKIDENARLIFGSATITRMKNYTDKANIVFAKKMLGGYTLTTAMSYLRAYLMDYFKKDIRELADLLIVRGQWSVKLQAQQVSEAYHNLLEIAEQIVSFDDSLADDSEYGSRMRSALAKSERDKEAQKYLRGMLKDANGRAQSILAQSAINLIAIGRHLKALIEDYAKPHHEILLNWKELEIQSAKPIKQLLIEVYKKLYYMVQLLQYFVKNEE